MYTLYIDTHSGYINIILYKEDKIIKRKEIESNFNHSITTMPIIIDTLKEASIDVKEVKDIIVVNGPGSFTGVRIGVTIAKTLAYTLQIPVKVMSSLLIKAVSFTHEEVHIVEREKNGVFIGHFSKENTLLEEYNYLKNSEYNAIHNKENYIENIEIDYLKVKKFAKKIESINPHAVNPLYVKKIEVQK